MRRRGGAAWVVAAAVCGLGGVGCAPEEEGLRVEAINPTPAQQDGALTLYGEGFGAFDETRSQVLVNGRCGDVLLWRDDRVVVVVPTGVGVGARVLSLVTAGGERLDLPVELTGPALPARARRCTERLAAGVDDGAVDDGVLDDGSTDDGGTDDGGTDDGGTDDGGTDDSGTDDGDTDGISDDGSDDGSDGGGGWPYVVLIDLSNSSAAPPGADLDAIVVDSPTGATFFAERVIELQINGELTGPPDVALGEPDAFPDHPSTSVCAGGPQRAFSLGGSGSVLIVEMSAPVQAGDVVTVYEVGGCEPREMGHDVEAEPYQVLLVDDLSFSDIHELGSGTGTTSFSVAP